MKTTEKILAIDGKWYDKNTLVRQNFLFLGGEWCAGLAKTINGIEIKNLSMEEVLNIGKKNRKR